MAAGIVGDRKTSMQDLTVFYADDIECPMADLSTMFSAVSALAALLFIYGSFSEHFKKALRV